jgi:hypothetical protein
MKRVTLNLVFVVMASTASAFDFSDIANWTGTGSNESALVIDWEDGSSQHELAWGYRWSGSATGEQMVQAIASANPNLTYLVSSFPPYGDFVDDFKFDGSAFGFQSHDQNSTGQSAYWEYYQGIGTSVPTFVSQDNGFTVTALSDQSWDGWAWEPTYSSNNVPGADPIAAPAAVPEPASVLGLALAAVLIRRRR